MTTTAVFPYGCGRVVTQTEGEIGMSKKTVLNSFTVALGSVGAPTLIIQDLEGKKSEIVILPSMLPKFVAAVSTLQKEAPNLLEVEKAPRNGTLSREERQAAQDLIKAENRPDGWYGIATRIDQNAAFFHGKSDGMTVAFRLEADDIRRMIEHLENALHALAGTTRTIQ